MARVAIGIPVFNEEKYIRQTLESAISQLDTFPDIEIILSDNCSSDKTVSEIESVLNQSSLVSNRVKLVVHPENLGAHANFWHTFDNTDSEYFLWLGAHDQISPGYVFIGAETLATNKNISMFCGNHQAISERGEIIEREVSYQFDHENRAERYLRSIADLHNCYIFHSLFRRETLKDFERIEAPSGDHIIISRWLWFGKLIQSEYATYVRRYFSRENRLSKAINGNYVNESNNVKFFEAYLSDLDLLASSLPPMVKRTLIQQAADLLSKRFGVPFVE